MFFKPATVILVAGILGAFATPVARDTELILLSSKLVPDGNLTIWGVPPNEERNAISADNTAISKRCGSNDVTCSSDHQASRNVCNMLLSNLAASAGNGISTSPRAICLSSSGDKCCVTWASAVNGLTQGELVDAASKIAQVCGGSPLSGLARNVNLNGVCTTECLSNRETGCD